MATLFIADTPLEDYKFPRSLAKGDFLYHLKVDNSDTFINYG
jgi:hypothetical protein